jgi:hypothetical protein
MKKEGSYIGLNLSNVSIKQLEKLQKDLGITESFPFHITLVYSRKKIKMDLNTKINLIIKAEKFHIFDNTKDGGDRALVIFFDCPYCNKRHNYAKTMGATWDYPSYESHITLSYNWDKDIPDDNLLKDFKINIVSEYYEKLDLEWTDTNVKDKTLEENEKKVIKENSLISRIQKNVANKIKL